MVTRQGITELKQRRREHLARLMDEAGGKGPLGEKLGMNPDYLWQMAKGESKSARSVSDQNAAKIEEKLGKPPGWLGSIEGASPSQSVTLDGRMIGNAIRVADYLRDVSLEPVSESTYAEFLAAAIHRVMARRTVSDIDANEVAALAKQVIADIRSR